MKPPQQLPVELDSRNLDNNDHSQQPLPQQPRFQSNLNTLKNGIAVGQVVCCFHKRKNKTLYGIVESIDFRKIDFRPNVTVTTFGDDSYTVKWYGGFVKILDIDFYKQRNNFLARELEALEAAWKFRELLLQNYPGNRGSRPKRDYTHQLDNGVTIGRIACCRRHNGQFLYGEVKSFRGTFDRLLPNVLLEDLSSGYQFSRYGGSLQPLDLSFYQQRKQFLESEMSALHQAWQVRNRLYGLPDLNSDNQTRLLVIALQVNLDESRDINSHYTCASLAFPDLQVFGCNALDVLNKWVEAYAIQPMQINKFCEFYERSLIEDFDPAVSDYVCLDIQMPERFCFHSEALSAIGKWVSLYSHHSGIELLQSFQTHDFPAPA